MKLRKETRTGIFVILVLAISFVMIEFLKGKDVFSSSHEFHVFYPEIDGIGQSTSVTVLGYDAGKVTSVTYNPELRNYTIGFSVSEEYSVPSDSYVAVYSSDILGTKKLKLVLGTSLTEAEEGDTLPGIYEQDMISALLSSLAPTKDRIDSLLANLDRTVSNVNTILDDGMQMKIDRILENLSSATGHLDSMTYSLSGSAPEIGRILMNVDTLSETLKHSAVPLESTVTSLKSTLDSLQVLIAAVRNPEGSIGKLTTSDSLYNSIHSLTADLDSLVKRIEKDPKKYIKISVF